MYAPDPDNVCKLVLDFSYGSEPSFYADYNFSAENILLPECGYIITPDFSIIYDISKVDDGTVAGNNDAQIILLNFILDYLANHAQDFIALSHILSSRSSLSRYQSENVHILIPEVDLADIDKKQFLVGKRVHTSREFKKNEVGDAYFKSLQSTIKISRILGLPEFSSAHGSQYKKYPLQTILDNDPMPFIKCTEFYENQFTTAIGQMWETTFTSGWYDSNGAVLVRIEATNSHYFPVVYIVRGNPGLLSKSTQPLGVEYALIDVPEEHIESFISSGFVVSRPDKFYLLRFENERNVGAFKMAKTDCGNTNPNDFDWYFLYSGNSHAKWATLYGSWRTYVRLVMDYHNTVKNIAPQYARSVVDFRSRITTMLQYHIDWYKIIFIPLAEPVK